MDRIQDSRVRLAQRGQRIPGRTRGFSEKVAITADVLTDCHRWSDVLWGFPGKTVQDAPGLWRVHIAGRWWMQFEWLAPWGPMEQRLYRV